MKLFIALILSIQVTAHATTWHNRTFRVSDGSEIAQADFFLELSQAQLVILGEKHYTPAVQQRQADIILNTNEGKNYLVAWEFLNHSEQAKVQSLFADVKTKKISAQDFLDQTQGTGRGTPYLPVIEAAAKDLGSILATNLTRQEKAPVTKDGIAALDPNLLPTDFQMCSANYFERFNEVMKQHVPPEKMQNYFAAQCLTDEVIATQVLAHLLPTHNYLVEGNFHTDYFDGTVASIRRRATNLSIKVVRFVDASDYTVDELTNLAGEFQHKKYGPMADYIIYVNEPNRLARHPASRAKILD